MKIIKIILYILLVPVILAVIFFLGVYAMSDPIMVGP